MAVTSCGIGHVSVPPARGVLGELDEREARGEYVPAFSRLQIHVGLDDVAGVRRELALAVEEVTPPFSLWVGSTPCRWRHRR